MSWRSVAPFSAAVAAPAFRRPWALQACAKQFALRCVLLEIRAFLAIMFRLCLHHFIPGVWCLTVVRHRLNPAVATTFIEPVEPGLSVTGWSRFCLIGQQAIGFLENDNTSINPKISKTVGAAKHQVLEFLGNVEDR